MCHIIYMSFVNSLALPYFWILSHKRHGFRENLIWNKMCVLMSRTSFYETFLVIRRNERNAIKKMSIGLHVNYTSFLSDFNVTWIFSTYFLRIIKQISRKSVKWKLMYYMWTKLTVALRNFANAPKNGPSYRASCEPTNIKTKKCEFTPRPILTPKSYSPHSKFPIHLG